MDEITREEFTVVSNRSIESRVNIVDMKIDINGLGKKLREEMRNMMDRIDSIVWKVFFLVTVPVLIGFGGIIMAMYKAK